MSRCLHAGQKGSPNALRSLTMTCYYFLQTLQIPDLNPAESNAGDFEVNCETPPNNKKKELLLLLSLFSQHGILCQTTEKKCHRFSSRCHPIACFVDPKPKDTQMDSENRQLFTAQAVKFQHSFSELQQLSIPRYENYLKKKNRSPFLRYHTIVTIPIINSTT